jgi:hypothetical protein
MDKKGQRALGNEQFVDYKRKIFNFRFKSIFKI